MKTKNLKQNSGVATIELLIAFAILIINITAVVLIINGGQSVSIDSETNEEATAKAKSFLEDMKVLAKEDFNLINPSETQEISGALAYTKSLEVESGPDNPDTALDESLFTKLVTSVIEWPALGGRILNVRLKTLISNPDAVSGGDTCGSVLEGDWSEPEIITYKYEPSGDYICVNGEDEDGHNCNNGYEFGKDILNDSSSGFPVSSILTFNNKMYVTVNNTKGNNDETFFILDISDAPELNSSHVMGKLDNSPEDEGDISEGLNAVAIDGKDYAYVANAYDSAPDDCVEADNCAQLQVIDISDVNDPKVVRNFKVDSFTTSDKLAYGTSILYKDDIVYLGLAKSNGPELFKIDVSNPLAPDIMTSAEVGNGVNSILVDDGYVYVASPNADDLQVYNVSNLNKVGFFNGPNGNANGKSLYKVGTRVYLGRTTSSSNEFYILNASAAPTISSTPIGVKNITSSINGLIVRDILAFFVTNTEFQIWNISNPSNISEYASPITLPPGSGGVQGSATDCEGNFIFIGSQKEAEGAGGQAKGYISIITGGEEDE